MRSLTDWSKDFLHAELPQHPSMFWRLQRGFILTMMNVRFGRVIPFIGRNHFRVVELRAGYVKAKIALKGNQNHLGTMYAGAMFLLAEVPGGVMSLFEFGSGYLPILKKLTMHYLLPVTSDLTIEVSLTQAELDAVRQVADEKGKSDFTLLLDMKDAQGQVVAQSEAVYQLRVKG